MTSKELYQQKNQHELEQNIRERCLNRVVKNDGTEMKLLLEDACSATEVTRAEDYVFAAKNPRVEQILIFTEPVNGGEEYVRITGYNVEQKKESGITPILKNEETDDAHKDLVDFAQTIDFRALYSKSKWEFEDAGQSKEEDA